MFGAVLDIPAGRIQIIAADRADTTVEVRPANPAKSRDTKTADQTTVADARGVLKITASAPSNQLFGPSGSLEVTVQWRPPAGPSKPRPPAPSSAASGASATSPSKARTARSRSTRPRASASLRSTATSRSAVLNGPAEISTARGDIRITEAARGTVVLRTQSGDITVGAAAGVSRRPGRQHRPRPHQQLSQERWPRRTRHPRHHLPRRHHRPQPLTGQYQEAVQDA